MAARVLAIDVTGPDGGAALLTPEGLSEARIPPEVRRGRDLVPNIARLLREAALRPADLDLVACGVGPGSFTGIRIGVATAAAFAWAAGLPVLDVPSLHGIAANAPADAGHVLVVLDARRGHVFAGFFRRDDQGRLVPCGDDRIAPPEQILNGLPEGTWVLGDGRAKFPALFERFPGAARARVRPDTIAHLAAERFAKGERKRPDELKPLYLRLSDPEIRANR